ncbi:hypothetical protein FB107DRAFT_294140 [Schizophyllum commune]
MSSSQATSSDASLIHGISSRDLVALLRNDNQQTPLFLQQDYLDEITSPWDTSEIDWSSVDQTIVAGAPGLCTLISQMAHDVHGDTIQNIVVQPADQGSTSADVVASIDLNKFNIFGPFPVDGRDSPVYVAAYTQHLPEPFLSAAGRPAASGGTGPRSAVSTLARRIAADARRSKNCTLFHLCPICEGMLTRKSTLKGQFPLALELCLLTELLPIRVASHFQAQHCRFSNRSKLMCAIMLAIC